MKRALALAATLTLLGSPCFAEPILVALAPPDIGPGLEETGSLAALVFEVLSSAGIRVAGPKWVGQRSPSDARCQSSACREELLSHGIQALLAFSWTQQPADCALSLTLHTRAQGRWGARQGSARAACTPEGLSHAVRTLLGGAFPAEAPQLKRPTERGGAEEPRAPAGREQPSAGETQQRDPWSGAVPPKAGLPPANGRDETLAVTPEAAAEERHLADRPPPAHDPAPRLEPPTDPGGRSLEDRLAGDHRLGPRREARGSGLKAGAADDNLQFGAFLRFLAETEVPGPRRDLSERWIITVRDRNGAPVANAKLQAFDGEQLLVERTSYADGRALFFPSEHPGLRSPRARLVVRAGAEERRVALGAGGRLAQEIRLEGARQAPATVPLDVVFVLDTTASMGDEIERIKQTIDEIRLQISQAEPRPDVRFGMVLYRDQGDEDPIQVVPLTADAPRFWAALSRVEAGGGGDTPEDVQSALEALVTRLAWRSEGVRLAFLIGDAPPHFDYGQTYTYQSASAEAARRGIKIATIGCSGLDQVGEAVWRQIAQYTSGPFVFLTRGESGDSEGSASSVSHHVGSNWLSGNLDALIVKTIKFELSNYGERGAPRPEDYFEASASAELGGGDVLDELFQQSVSQLLDYALMEVAPATPTMLLPISARARPLKRSAEILDQRLAVALGRSSRFRLIERDGAALDEAMAQQFKAGFDESKAVELGKRVPARLAIVSELDRGGGRLQVLLRLVKLETGEVLSVSMLKIADRLVL